jgi:class 3 adenylate cyclase
VFAAKDALDSRQEASKAAQALREHGEVDARQRVRACFVSDLAPGRALDQLVRFDARVRETGASVLLRRGGSRTPVRQLEGNLLVYSGAAELDESPPAPGEPGPPSQIVLAATPPLSGAISPLPAGPVFWFGMALSVLGSVWLALSLVWFPAYWLTVLIKPELSRKSGLLPLARGSDRTNDVARCVAAGLIWIAMTWYSQWRLNYYDLPSLPQLTGAYAALVAVLLLLIVARLFTPVRSVLLSVAAVPPAIPEVTKFVGRGWVERSMQQIEQAPLAMLVASIFLGTLAWGLQLGLESSVRHAVRSTTASLVDWVGKQAATLAVLFTDIVDSTKLLYDMGDEEWKRVLDAHFDRARNLAVTNNGHEVKTTGDGMLIVFKAAPDALQFALAFREHTGDRRLHVRTGAHFGEVSVEPQDVIGKTVHIAARVMGASGPQEICVTDEAKHQIDAEGRPAHRELPWVHESAMTLKGIPDKFALWKLPASAPAGSAVQPASR